MNQFEITGKIVDVSQVTHLPQSHFYITLTIQEETIEPYSFARKLNQFTVTAYDDVAHYIIMDHFPDKVITVSGKMMTAPPPGKREIFLLAQAAKYEVETEGLYDFDEDYDDEESDGSNEV